MNGINIKKFGLACGQTGAISYMGCILLMATVGYKGTVGFFNSLFHGLNVSSAIRMRCPSLGSHDRDCAGFCYFLALGCLHCGYL